MSLDGLHGPTTRRARIRLEKGDYPFEVGFFERGGGQKLEFDMTGPGRLFRPATR